VERFHEYFSALNSRRTLAAREAGVAHKSLYGQRKIQFPSGLRLGPKKTQNSDADHRRHAAA
jgi:hypothetical protein